MAFRPEKLGHLAMVSEKQSKLDERLAWEMDPEAGILPPDWKVQRKSGGGIVLRRWVRRTSLGLIVALFVLLWWVENVFRLRSNLVLLAYRERPLPAELVLGRNQRIEPHQLRRGQLEKVGTVLFSGDGLTVSRLNLDRKRDKAMHHLAMALSPNEVNIFEFSTVDHDFGVSFLQDFELTTASERRKSEGAIFAINANFHDPEGAPLGLVIREGRVENPRFPNWTGFFFVADGKAFAGPTSLFEPMAHKIDEAVQVYPSVMRDHQIFHYVEMAPTLHFRGDSVTYRSLVGMREGGDIVFVVSGNGGVMDVAEVTHIARGLGVKHATLLDGGRALQYSFRASDFQLEFSSFNNDIKLDGRLRKLDRVRSPVFIEVMKR